MINLQGSTLVSLFFLIFAFSITVGYADSMTNQVPYGSIQNINHLEEQNASERIQNNQPIPRPLLVFVLISSDVLY